MHFALVDGQRTPPSLGLKGSCPVCGAAMIPKCGNIRVHHWAHRGERVCDSWWERETEWHRAWKNRFPDLWQEFIQYDELGEKHIADVRTPHDLTIEFQHSHLGPDEMAAREKFYGNMLWVVDGARLKRDLPRFLGQTSSFRALTQTGLYLIPFPEEAFPRSWISCSMPVLFDFRNAIAPSQEALYVARSLWCLLPGRVLGKAVAWQIPREPFVRSIHNTAVPIPTLELLKHVEALLQKEQQAQIARLRAAEMAMRQRSGWSRQGFRRRYARF